MVSKFLIVSATFVSVCVHHVLDVDS